MYNGSLGSGDDVGLDSDGQLELSTASYSYDPGSPPPPMSDEDGFLPPPPPDLTSVFSVDLRSIIVYA